MAIADHFVETFCVEENPRRCFIQIPALSQYPHMRAEPEKYIFQDNVVHDKIIDYEGFIPAIQTRHRFIKALKKCGDNVPRIFILLNQTFRTEAIKVLFPDIWIGWNNVKARKAATTERNLANRRRKFIPRSEQLLHKQCSQVTQNMSYREAARSSRVLI